MSVDPIQNGILEIERQRKSVKFNLKVLWAAIRENSAGFKAIRDDDYIRNDELRNVLLDSSRNSDTPAPNALSWKIKAETHALALTTNSKIYEVMIALFAVITTYFIGSKSHFLSILFGLILICFTLAKWGVDKYLSALSQIAVRLQEISDS